MSNGKVTASAVTDPGKDKVSASEKKAERLKYWKRPKTDKEKKDLRDERLSHVGGKK